MNTILIAPFTSTRKSYPTSVNITFQSKNGQIALDQLRSVDKIIIKAHGGTLIAKSLYGPPGGTLIAKSLYGPPGGILIAKSLYGPPGGTLIAKSVCGPPDGPIVAKTLNVNSSENDQSLETNKDRVSESAEAGDLSISQNSETLLLSSTEFIIDLPLT